MYGAVWLGWVYASRCLMRESNSNMKMLTYLAFFSFKLTPLKSMPCSTLGFYGRNRHEDILWYVASYHIYYVEKIWLFYDTALVQSPKQMCVLNESKESYGYLEIKLSSLNCEFQISKKVSPLSGDFSKISKSELHSAVLQLQRNLRGLLKYQCIR